MKMKLLLFLGLFVGSVGLSFLIANNTHATTADSFLAPMNIIADHAAGHIGSGEEAEAEAGTTCRVEGIGWIICPVVKVMASLVDGAYAFVSSLLVVQPLVSTAAESDANASIYAAWTIMRNFANVAFVIAFLIIIFSQLTSVGLNNYGIKKMLPRLIVAAILVNVSFWICALAIDISNILGASINGLFQGMEAGLPTSVNKDPIADGTGWAGIAGLVVAGTLVSAGALYAVLSALLPALLAALIAIVTVFLVLTLRQALIILLVVISPLAFVAYLLPNTESLFKKWMSLFRTLLLMYPIIAMLFGASALASAIVMQSATGDYKVAIQIMGALVAIIPLALTPIVMKTAGALLNRFGGTINNPNKGPVDKLRKKADAFKDRRADIANTRRLGGTNMFRESSKRLGKSNNRFARGAGRAIGTVDNIPLVSKSSNKIASKMATSALNTEAKNENAKRALSEGKQDFIANNASTDAEYAQKLAGPTGNAIKLQASALEAVDKRERDEVKAGETLVKLHPDFNPDQSHLPENDRKSNAELAWERAITEGNETLAQAAQNIMVSQMGTSGVDKFKNLLNAAQLSESMDKALRTNISENHTGMKGTSADLDAWAHSDKTTLQSHTQDAKLWAGLSDAHIASQTPGSIEAAGLSGGLDAIRADSIMSNDRLNTTIKGAQKAEFQKIIGTSTTTNNTSTIQTNNSTVNVPPAPSQPPTINVQQAPSVPGQLNVPHNNTPQPPTVNVQPAAAPPQTINIQAPPQFQSPPGSTPANSRTSMPPNAGNINQQRPSGLWVDPKNKP